MSPKARKCTVCYEEFESYSALKEHWMVHLRHLQQDDDSESDDTADKSSERNSSSSDSPPNGQEKNPKKSGGESSIEDGIRCPHCNYRATKGKMANRRQRLQEHANAKHLGIKNHACQYCKFRSSYHSNLFKHVKFAHPGKKVKTASKAKLTSPMHLL